MLFAAIFFVLFFKASAIDLQFQMSGEYGQFSSPNYPDKYPVNMTCRWTIATAASTRILLNFTDFRVEKNKKCLYDYLVIKESKNGWGTISSKYCGHGSLTTYLSQENHLQIFFVSDKLGNVDKGFVANWKVTDLNGIPIKRKELAVAPTKSQKPCLTVTVTKAPLPCTNIKLEPTTSVTRVTSSKCNCNKPLQKTVYKTVTEYHGQAEKIKPTASASNAQVHSTITSNVIPRNGSKCGNDATYGKQATSSNNTSRNIVIAFGCLLFVLIVANIILVAVICRRDNSGYSLYSMKTCLPRKTAKPRSVEHFYSSGPRPTLRMVDGDIVVVSTNGKVVRQQAPSDQTTLETSDNSHVQVQIASQPENQPRQCDRLAPEIPFHLVPPPEGQSTLSSAEMSSFHEHGRTSSLSDAESDFY